MKKLLSALTICASLFCEEVQIKTTDYSDLPKGTTQLDAIVLDKNGQMTEQKATLNGSSVSVNVAGGENASVFFPDLGERYVWNGGHWVNKAGYYYVNNEPVYAGIEGWDGSWDNYWNHHWNDHWNRYYNGHHGDGNWRWHNNNNWNHHWHDHRRYNRHTNPHHHDHHDSHNHHHSSHHHSGGHHGGGHHK
jgi:hypothetical protein